VKDLTTVIVKSVPELERMLFAGMKNRKVGETAMNKDSSRSHSIFTIYIETAEAANVSDLMPYKNFRMVQGNKRLKLVSSTWSIWPVLNVRARLRRPGLVWTRPKLSTCPSQLWVTSSRL
jgi:hypothetical protein